MHLWMGQEMSKDRSYICLACIVLGLTETNKVTQAKQVSMKKGGQSKTKQRGQRRLKDTYLGK